jgi:hypothetical protein
MRFRPANIRLTNRRSKLPRLLLSLSSKNNKRNRNDKSSPTDSQTLTGSLHIRDLANTEKSEKDVKTAGSTYSKLLVETRT